MASKRMFSPQIVQDETFIEMSASAQVLYFQLSLCADDFGIVSNINQNLRYLGIDKKYLLELIENDFLIEFDDEKKKLIVIKHWYINNNLRTDRTTPTIHNKVVKRLFIDSSKAYTTDKKKDCQEMHPPYFDIMKKNGSQVASSGRQDDSQIERKRDSISHSMTCDENSKEFITQEPEWMNEEENNDVVSGVIEESIRQTKERKARYETSEESESAFV